jgi:DNA-binding MarR family transcriptional regulator
MTETLDGGGDPTIGLHAALSDALPQSDERRELAGRMTQVLPSFGSWAESIRDQTVVEGNLGPRQVQILYTLRHRLLGSDQTTPSALANLFGIQPSVITRVLSRLEAAGYVTRTVDPHDARSLVIRITTAGTDISARIEDYYIDSMVESMAFADEAQLDCLREALPALARIALSLENRRRTAAGRPAMPFPEHDVPLRGA